MKVKELKEQLEHLDDEQEVFYKLRSHVGDVGEIYYLYLDYYQFFGLELPCVILDSEAQEGISEAEIPF